MSGVVASFATEPVLEHALARLKQAGIAGIETYTPKALAADEAGTGSPLPLMIFIAGICGAAAMFALESYADVLNWPVDIGGRPAFSWPAFVPIAFEVGVLCAVLTGFLGFLFLSGAPRLWEPVDECAAARKATRAGWIVAVYSDDPAVLAHARHVMESLGPLSLEAIPQALIEVPA